MFSFSLWLKDVLMLLSKFFLSFFKELPSAFMILLRICDDVLNKMLLHCSLKTCIMHNANLNFNNSPFGNLFFL